jgi:hypothetical protein
VSPVEHPKEHLHPGFVAMEYYALMLNRSFLFFIAETGLLGWQFIGIVTAAAAPRFYEPVEELLDDPEMAPGSPGFLELLHEMTTFTIPYASIESVEFAPKRKWGMGPILHTGLLNVRFKQGRKREFILLGSACGETIRNAITSRMSPT